MTHAFVGASLIYTEAELCILSLPAIEHPYRTPITAHGGVCQQMSLRAIEHHAEAYFVAESNRAQLFLDFYDHQAYATLHISALSKEGMGEPERR
jgi:hypothetical protein